MIATIPPRGHVADASVTAEPDAHVHRAGGHRRVRQRHHHRAHPDRGQPCAAWNRTGSPCARADTDLVLPRTPAPSARRAASWPAGAVHAAGVALCKRLHAGAVPGHGDGAPLVGHGRHDVPTPRSLAFNVHGFRVAVHPGTGQVRRAAIGARSRRGHGPQPRQCRWAKVEGRSRARAFGTSPGSRS